MSPGNCGPHRARGTIVDVITKAPPHLLPSLVLILLGIAGLVGLVPAQAEPRVGIRPILGIQAERVANTEGLVVDAVMPDTPAARMGMTQGDVLLALNGMPIHSIRDVHTVMLRLGKGQRLQASFRHGESQVTAEDALPDVPVLPSYEIQEGKGLKGSVSLGDDRDQVEKALGKAPGEGDRDSFKVLAYPRHGITVFLLPAEGTWRVALVRVQYPFVGKTSRGLSTAAPSHDIPKVYSGQARSSDTIRQGRTVETLPGLGIQFICLEDQIIEVLVTPPELSGPSPAPSPRPAP